MDSALRKDENYYPQVFLKERKYIEKKVVRHINNNLSDFSSSNESDEKEIKISFLKKRFGLCLKDIGHHFANGKCTQKKRVVFLKLGLECIKIQKTIH